MSDPIGTAAGLLYGAVHFFQTLVPGGFGVLLIPLGVLGLVTIYVARKA